MAAKSRHRYDAKLLRVADAIENLTRDGETIASGASERCPPLGFGFKGDHDGHLHFHVGPYDVRRIQARATTIQRQNANCASWEVEGAALEQHNARWPLFLRECFESMRTELGVAPAAVADMVLDKMVMVEAGAQLHVRQRNKEKGRGMFGSLVVALPGAFTGGSIVRRESRQDEQAQADDKKSSWCPDSRKNAHDIAYAAFYDGCGYVAEPVGSGTAVFLVYNLITTTPSEIPFYGGPALLEQAVHSALTNFFDVAPAQAAKRLKGDEKKMEQTLADFCNSSDGQFVLYHTGVLYSLESEDYSGYGHHSSMENDGEDLKVTLKSPWLKYGSSNVATYPPISVQQEREVAPLGRAGDAKLYIEAYDMDMDDYDIIEKIHYNFRRTGVGNMHALIVQPTSIEQDQVVKVPIEDATTKLKGLLLHSRDDALQYARRVIHYRSPWRYFSKEAKHFPSFLKVVIEIDDLELFKAILVGIVPHYNGDSEIIRSAVKHFGWNACVETLKECILSTVTLRGRVTLINSTVDASLGPAILEILDPLLSLHPWTNVKVKSSKDISRHQYQPTDDAFCHLLGLADASSREKLMQVVSPKDPDMLIGVVVPTLKQLMKKHEGESLKPVVQHVTDIFHRMLPVLQNEVHAKVRIPKHCRKCTALQAFMTSTATQTMLTFKDEAQRKHIESVVGEFKYPATVTIATARANKLQLTKKDGQTSFDLYHSAQRTEETLKELVSFDQQNVRAHRYSWE